MSLTLSINPFLAKCMSIDFLADSVYLLYTKAECSSLTSSNYLLDASHT